MGLRDEGSDFWSQVQRPGFGPPGSGLQVVATHLRHGGGKRGDAGARGGERGGECGSVRRELRDVGALPIRAVEAPPVIPALDLALCVDATLPGCRGFGAGG